MCIFTVILFLIYIYYSYLFFILFYFSYVKLNAFVTHHLLLLPLNFPFMGQNTLFYSIQTYNIEMDLFIDLRV